MDLLSKENITYIVIFIFILLSLTNLYNRINSDNENDSNSNRNLEAFEIIVEDQRITDIARKIYLPSVETVQFATISSPNTFESLGSKLNKIDNKINESILQVQSNVGIQIKTVNNNLTTVQGNLNRKVDETSTNINSNLTSLQGNLNKKVDDTVTNVNNKITDLLNSVISKDSTGNIIKDLTVGSTTSSGNNNVFRVNGSSTISKDLNVLTDILVGGTKIISGVDKSITCGAINGTGLNINTSYNSKPWHNYSGIAPFVISTSTVPAREGCLSIIVNDWIANSKKWYADQKLEYVAPPTKVYAAINCGGRLHITSTEEVIICASATHIWKDPSNNWSGNLTVHGILRANSGIVYIGTDLVLTSQSSSVNISTGGRHIDFSGGLGFNIYNKLGLHIHKGGSNGGDGNLQVGGIIYFSATAAYSDIRLKENIKNISQNEKDKVLQLVPKTYNFIKDEKKEKRFGLIAQEVEVLFPELVSTNSTNNPDGMKSLNYMDLIPLLLEQIKDMNQKIKDLEKIIRNSYKFN